MVDYEAAGNAIRTRYGTLIEDVVPGMSGNVQYDNAPFDPPEDAMWSRVAIRYGPQRATEHGATLRYRTNGVAIVSVFTPIESGDRDGLVVADTIVEAFRAVTADGVKYISPNVESMGRQRMWWLINVTIEFQFQDQDS